MKKWLFFLVVLLLIAAEILKVYFIMPFPGSQHANTIDIAYFLHQYIWWFRIIGWLAVLLLWFALWGTIGRWGKFGMIVGLLLYTLIFYFFNFRFLADKMFYQPRQKLLLSVTDNRVDSNALVVGISINGVAKAYPIEIIGYHHQVQDTLGGQPIIMTYCTVCRTGRAYSPMMKGIYQQFRLVGMDHFNAMFEDEATHSWWRQASGEAIAGPLKGTALKELPTQQMRLGAWVRGYPNTLILQPDPAFAKQYKDLQGFDMGTINSGLEKRDTASWKFKSWVVGIVVDGHTKAYDWNELLQQRIIQDTINGKNILLLVEKDKASFHAWNRQVKEQVLQFSLDEAYQTMKDSETNSVWNMEGICIDGSLKGNQLLQIPAYQEFWHSWKSFHPGTRIYATNKE